MKNLVCIILLAVVSVCAAVERPNVIIYMVDDLGWNHISASQVTQGTHKKIYRTPNLEKLANQGLTFTWAYAQPNCAPTRAAMLSGQYAARVNNDVYVVGHLNRFGRGGISKAKSKFLGPKQTEDVGAAAVTLAEALKKNGYATAHIGKYHVGGHDGQETMPEKVGFDINFGGCKDGHQRTCFASQKNGTWDFRGVGLGAFAPFAKPYTKAYVQKYGFPESLVGTPKHITDALGDAMEDTVKKFAAAGKPFYLQFHTYAVHGPVKSRPDLQKTAAARGAEGRMASYAGFITSVDLNVRRMLDALDDPNGDGDTGDSIAKNTLILFTSDNGGTHADNLPLKGKKGMFTEGGIRVPLIAYWPGVIEPNTQNDRMVHCVDYYPTLLALAGGKWTPSEAEHPLDGESFAEVLRKPKAKHTRGAIFYLFPGYMDTRAQPCVVAIDDVNGKRYKLFYYYEANAWELYCLSDDQAEKTNLIEGEKAIAESISKKMHVWLNQEHPTWKPKYPLAKDTMKPVRLPAL